MLCSITLVCLVAISGYLSELSLNNFVSSLTRRGINWKLALIFSPVLGVSWSRTSGNSLVFPTLTLGRTILLQAAVRGNLCISHFYSKALSSWFRNSHWKIILRAFMSFTCFQILIKLSNEQTLKALLAIIRLLKATRNNTRKWKLSFEVQFDFTPVVPLANQISWPILIRIMIGLF